MIKTLRTGTPLKLTITTVVAKSRKLKCNWTMAAVVDLMFNEDPPWKDAWVKKVSEPGYELTKEDQEIMEKMLDDPKRILIKD